MRELTLHPDCDRGPIEQVRAEIRPSEGGCEARFRVEGDMSRVLVPASRPADRRDDLWKTTCFEIFWQPEAGTAYREFNLSPSTRWAAYDFDDVRQGAREAAAAVNIVCVQSDSALELTAVIDSDLPLPAAVALNAIVEDLDGTLFYWALDFAEGNPDFHSPACRTAHLAGRL